MAVYKKHFATAVFVFVMAVGMPLVVQGQGSSDISANPFNTPGMEKTTSGKQLKLPSSNNGAASAITPAATGRLYPTDGSLLIGQGDMLHISVLGESDYDDSVRVDPSGKVDIFDLRRLPVENMKPSDVAIEIEKHLKNDGIMVEPKVNVEITDYISHGAALQGEVRNPGIYPILGQRRLSDLLAAAGGRTEMSTGVAYVRHPSSPEPERIVLDKVENSYIIVPGDTVTLQRAPLVYILGNVRHAGGFPLVQPTSVSQGLSLAQGLAPSAKDKKCYLFRARGDGTRVVIDVNVNAILRGKQADMALLPDDVLFIPNSAIADVGKAIAAAAPSLGYAFIVTR